MATLRGRRRVRGRRSSAVRAGIGAAVIGLFALTALPGASAVVAAQPTGPPGVAATTTAMITGGAEGDTQCVPSGTGGLGLTCTGTFSGNTAFDPWTWQNLPAADQPVVTVSQAKNLTDQDVTVTWKNFTPSIGEANFEPNPGTDIDAAYQVSLFECNGTSPDANDGYTSDCYTVPVGSTERQQSQGPANAEVEDTEDASVPASAPRIGANGVWSDYSPLITTLGPAFGVGNGSLPADIGSNSPSTWTGQATFHVEAPTPRAKGGFFNCGPSAPCSLVIDPNWGGTPAAPGSTGATVCAGLDGGPGGPSSCSNTNTSLCNDHYLGLGVDPLPPFTTAPDPDFDDVSDIFGSGAGPGFGQSQSPLNTGAGTGSPTQIGQASYACWEQDRIVIPLSFAPSAQNCPGTTPQFAAEGSPMLEDQMLQWQAGFCTGTSPVALSSTFDSESQARGDFLTGAATAGTRTDMALVTLPPDASQTTSRKFTYAPLANSGTGIAFNVDDAVTGTPDQRMVLSPLLLAELTTQSYTLRYGCTAAPPAPWPPNPQPNENCDPAVLGNPFSLFDDPEFLSLNTGCQPAGQPASYTCGKADFPSDNGNVLGSLVQYGEFLPTVLQPDDDMTYDMTGWVGADSSAASFLSGKPDSAGFHVNLNYVGVSYPEEHLNVQDDGISGYPGGLPPCTAAGNTTPGGACASDYRDADATMSASWNFQTDLNTITQDLLTNAVTAQEGVPTCNTTGDVNQACSSPQQMNTTTGISAEYPGNAALLSQLDLGNIENYEFPAASLVNGAGKAVAPSQASVEAAVGDMQTNPDGITQFLNPGNTDANAYPLSMVDYAMVPTCGLSSGEASAIADFLTKVATTGQVQGSVPGDLGPGYYPLTARQKAQTLMAAAAVRSQDCQSAPPDTTIGGKTPPHDVGLTSPSASGPSTPGGAPAGGARSRPAVRPSASAGPAQIAPAGQGTTGARPLAFGQKSGDSGLAGLLLLLAIISGALLLVGAPAAWAITATGRWPALLRWLEPVRRRLRAARVRGV